ncbi:MAG: hypothetical protein M3312_03935 [Actinomycetota bacterium]|nr:hypothetical protein [Actinomycetota bacterium]
MNAPLLALSLAQGDVAEEGRRIVIGMLLVGIVFLGVIVVGQLSRWLSHRRRARRPRPY